MEQPQHRCCSLLIIPVSLADHDAINARFLRRTSKSDGEFEEERPSPKQNCKQCADTRQTGSTGPRLRAAALVSPPRRPEAGREGAAFRRRPTSASSAGRLTPASNVRQPRGQAGARRRRFSAGSPSPGPAAPPPPRGKRWTGPAAAQPTADLTWAPRSRPGRPRARAGGSPEEVRQPRATWARAGSRGRSGASGEGQGDLREARPTAVQTRRRDSGP